MLCQLCFDDDNEEYFTTCRVVAEVTVADMTSLSSGYLSPSSRRSLFLCRPCVERVQAAGTILSRWRGKLDLILPKRLCGDDVKATGPADGNNLGIQDLGGRFQSLQVASPCSIKFPPPPMIKSSASIDSGITFDSDSNGEFFEAEDISRPSTAFASAEEDEAECLPFRPPSASNSVTSGNVSPPVASSPSALSSSAPLGVAAASMMEMPFSAAASTTFAAPGFPRFSSAACHPFSSPSSPSSFSGFLPSVLPSPHYSSSLPASYATPPPPPGFSGASPAVGSLPVLFQRPVAVSSAIGGGGGAMVSSPSASPPMGTTIETASSAPATTAYSAPMTETLPTQRFAPTRSSEHADSKTTLFSLKECRLGLEAMVPFEKKCQLLPSSSLLVGNHSMNGIPRPRPIQKTPVDLEVDLRGEDDFSDQASDYVDAATSPLQPTLLPLRPSSLSSSRRGCGFCLSNGERQRECMSHRLKNPDTLVVECPQLRKFVCPLCQATGDYAHTQGYCPLNDADIPTVKHLKKKRSSAGRLAGGKNLRPDKVGFGGYGAAFGNGSLGVVDPSIIAIGPKGGKRG